MLQGVISSAWAPMSTIIDQAPKDDKRGTDVMLIAWALVEQ